MVQCKECEAEIPPAWVHALSTGECPGCGSKLFSDDEQELMHSLKDAMEQMPNNPQGLAVWLLSNYRMQKIGNGEPTGFYEPKPKSKIDRDNLKIAPKNPLQRFQEASGLATKKTPEELSRIINQINSPDEDEYYDDEYLPEAEDPEYTKQALQAMEGTAIDRKLAAMKQFNMEEDYSEFDDVPTNDFLDEDRRARLLRQNQLQAGGVGTIKRSE